MSIDELQLAGSLHYLDELQLPPDVRKAETNGNGRPSAHAMAAATSFDRPGAVTLSPITARMMAGAAEQPIAIWPLVNAYRTRGHYQASLDPLGLIETAASPELDPRTWGFAQADLSRVVEPTGVHGMPRATVGDLLAHLREVYADTVGLEFMHISSPNKRTWLAEHMETAKL